VIVALQAADWWLVVPGSLLAVATWAVFAIRWRVLLRAAAGIQWTETFSYIMIGHLLNLIFPFRLGDVGRVALVSRKHRINIGFTAASVVLERFFDILILVALAGSLMVVVPASEAVRRVVQTAAIAAGGIFVVLVLLARSQNGLARLESALSGRLS